MVFCPKKQKIVLSLRGQKIFFNPFTFLSHFFNKIFCKDFFHKFNSTNIFNEFIQKIVQNELPKKKLMFSFHMKIDLIKMLL